MPELMLGDHEQVALRALLAAEPVPGNPVPPRDFLENVARLVPCDVVGACLALNVGPMIDESHVPRGYYDRYVETANDDTGGLYVGVLHWSRLPLQAEECQAILPGHVDAISVGFRSGPNAVAQIYLDRHKRPFSERDLAVLNLLVPVFQRHLRQAPTASLPSDVTVQERRVLMEVAAGHSNSEIAATLFIAQSTVRKHLENAFRKLGVTNRLAAVVALEGVNTREDRRERIARYA